ncbi:hypothetical protein [Geobacillus sp. TFV-3]|uniref:hypothetical protein n=1 Tax=Geobacillus sp. TFV-3 TaxID=1897059 RepID=UPI001F25CBEC|nr:hypothetical protein [Geobacillus sp. TFV-3]
MAPSLATRQDDVAGLSAFRGQIGSAASAVFERQWGLDNIRRQCFDKIANKGYHGQTNYDKIGKKVIKNYKKQREG